MIQVPGALILLLAATPPDPQQGRATVECQVTAKGQLRGCLVLSESPANANVGPFALQLVRTYRVAPNDRRIRNGKIRIPMRFKLPPRS